MAAHIYRAGYFFPSKDYPEDRLNQRSVGERIVDITLGTMLKTFTPHFYTPIELLGPYVLEIAKGRWPDQEVLRNVDMRKFIKSYIPITTAVPHI